MIYTFKTCRYMVHRPPFVSWSRNSKSESGPSVLWLVRASCFRRPGSSLRQVHCILVHFHGSPRTSTSFETFGDCEHLEERRLCVSVAAGYTSVDTDQSLSPSLQIQKRKEKLLNCSSRDYICATGKTCLVVGSL